MPRRRFFIPQDRIRDGTAVLTRDQAHHLRHVLRLGAGEEVDLFDGEGQCYSGKIECRGAEIHIGALKRLQPPEKSKTSLVLAAAIIKADRFEWMLQKGTELGVDRFLPLETRFSSVRIPAERLEARRERWQRIIREASKQSRRLTIPGIQLPLPFNDFVASPEYAASAKFILHEKAPLHLKAAIPAAPVLLCVGPEGGWDAKEIRAAEQAGFQPVSMGSRTMRAETAALAAVAVFQFLLEQPPVE